VGWVIEVLPHVRLILRLPYDRNSDPISGPGEELESVINDGIRPLVGNEVGCIRDEAHFHVISIGSVILQHTIR